jgi:hypothetical protein
LAPAGHGVKHVYALFPDFIIEYFNRICLQIETQQEIDIFTIAVPAHIAAGFKSPANIRFFKPMLKGCVTKDEFQLHGLFYLFSGTLKSHCKFAPGIEFSVLCYSAKQALAQIFHKNYNTPMVFIKRRFNFTPHVKMTHDEEADALDELLTRTTPKIRTGEGGFFYQTAGPVKRP